MIITGGPTLSGNYQGRTIGQGTDGRKIFDLYRMSKVSPEELQEIEGCMVRSAGHCTVMGTASTMAIVAEALGMSLPGSAAVPAPDSRRLAMAEMSGRRMVEMVREDLKPSQILTREAFENAITVDMAVGGSTNAVVHLLAIAGRTRHKLVLDDFDAISRRTPFLVNVRPSGQHMMEDFFFAGGVPAVMRELLPLLHRDCLTVNGKTIGDNVARSAVLQPRRDPHVRAADFCRRRHGGAARQSVPRWRGAQADGRLAPSFASTRARRTCSRATSRCTTPSTAWTCRSTRTRCW